MHTKTTKNYNAADILPRDRAEELMICLRFLENFKDNALPAGTRELWEMLDKVGKIAAMIQESIRIYEFLGQMEIERIATNDNDILDASSDFEQQLSQYKTLAGGIDAIHDRIIRVLSRSGLH